jgi:hypothetical protein
MATGFPRFSWLALPVPDYLAIRNPQRPHASSGPTKETRFFDKHFHRGIDWYRAHYTHATADQHVGEIAPTYFASIEASERIARTLPQAKVVCVFRHPVEQVMSLYKLKRAYSDSVEF